MSKQKKSSKESKRILLDCFFILIILQVARIIINKVFLSILNFTAININISNIISIMIVGISLSMFLNGNNLFNPPGYRLTMLSNKQNNKTIRLIFGLIAALGIVVICILKRSSGVYGLLLIVLYLLTMPVYEEILFRQYFWNYANSFSEDESKAWIITFVLSVLFTVGYWDIVSQNLSVITSAQYAVDVVFRNVGISALIALLAGFIRNKYKDIYLCIFLHIIISCIFYVM